MSVVIFWFIGAVLLAGLLYSLLRTLRSPHQGAALQTNEQTIVAIYQQRLQQTRLQFENGELDQQEYEQAQQELSHALGYELQTTAQNTAQARNPGKVTPWLLGIGIPLLAVVCYLLLGRPEALDHWPTDSAQQLSIPDMVAKLEQRLQTNPEDVDGWRMLGRSYTVLQNFTAARDAYAEAYKRVPESPDLALDYAEAIAYTNSNSLLGRPAELIEIALQRDPENLRGRILKGVALYHQNNVVAAVQLWKSVVTAPDLDEQTRSIVQNMIAQSEGATSAPAQAPSQPEPATGAAITVDVKLSPELAAKVSPQDTVFIFAQAAGGPKMPLAVARKRVADLPLQIVLDDRSAMTEGMNLSSFKQVIVVARVSMSGNATATSGDLQGSSAVIDPHQRPSLKLVIDTQLP